MKKLEVTLPVYNEEKILEQSVNTLREFMKQNLSDYEYIISIANNASKDRTREIAERLAEEFPEVKYVHLDEKGRGRALKKAWAESDADIVSYMDIDLSTDLEALKPMIDAIKNGYKLGTGTRLSKESKTKRGLKREFISRTYNLMVKMILNTKFTDAQCGFKAANKEYFTNLLPHLKDDEWFFDTELMTITEKLGNKIYEIPATWIEDKDSRVNI
jgi:glycosyltransferase involved in cell wall biosynthesis